MPCANSCADTLPGKRALDQDVAYSSDADALCAASLPATAPTLPKCQSFMFTGRKKRSSCFEDTCYVGAQVAPDGPEVWLPGCRDSINLADYPTTACGSGWFYGAGCRLEGAAAHVQYPACLWLTFSLFTAAPTTVPDCNPDLLGPELSVCSGECTSAVGQEWVGAEPMHELPAGLPGDCCDLCARTPPCGAWNFVAGQCQLFFESPAQPTRKLNSFISPRKENGGWFVPRPLFENEESRQQDMLEYTCAVYARISAGFLPPPPVPAGKPFGRRLVSPGVAGLASFIFAVVPFGSQTPVSLPRTASRSATPFRLPRWMLIR